MSKTVDPVLMENVSNVMMATISKMVYVQSVLRIVKLVLMRRSVKFVQEDMFILINFQMILTQLKYVLNAVRTVALVFSQKLLAPPVIQIVD